MKKPVFEVQGENLGLGKLCEEQEMGNRFGTPLKPMSLSNKPQAWETNVVNMSPKSKLSPKHIPFPFNPLID